MTGQLGTVATGRGAPLATHRAPRATSCLPVGSVFHPQGGFVERLTSVTVVGAHVPQGSGAEGALTPEEDPIQIWVTVRSRSGRDPGPPTSGELTGWDGALGRAAHRSYGETEARGGRRDAPGSLSSAPLGRPLSLSTHSPLSGPHGLGPPGSPQSCSGEGFAGAEGKRDKQEALAGAGAGE